MENSKANPANLRFRKYCSNAKRKEGTSGSRIGDKALASNENSPDAYPEVSRYFEQVNKKDSALSNPEKALADGPGNFDVNWKTGKIIQESY